MTDAALREKISRLLERYGAALGSGDTQTIADCWAVPALVLADQGAIAVTDPARRSRRITRRG